jgi:hypothetical protein
VGGARGDGPADRRGRAVRPCEWAGLVKKRTRSLLGRSMKLDLVTWPSYFARRLVGDWLPSCRRQVHDLPDAPRGRRVRPAVGGHPRPRRLRRLAAPALLQPPLAPTRLSGVLADRTYLASDLKPTLEALTELGNSGAGFDWRLAPVMATPGDLRTFRVRLDLGYPRLGRIAPAGLRWSTDTRRGPLPVGLRVRPDAHRGRVRREQPADRRRRRVRPRPDPRRRRLDPDLPQRDARRIPALRGVGGRTPPTTTAPTTPSTARPWGRCWPGSPPRSPCPGSRSAATSRRPCPPTPSGTT